MRIKTDKGYYSFQLEEDDMIYNLAAINIFDAKEHYLKYISEKIDDTIVAKLNQLERILKEADVK